MNDNLKFDESQKKRCWGCAFFSTSPNWAPVGSGSSEYSCYLHGGSHIRKVGSGSCFCDCWEKKLIDTEGYDVESDKSYYEAGEVHEAIRELKKKFEMQIADKDAEIAELKAKLEDAKASHYAESVDAGMRERRLRRALYKACANWAKCEERINNRDAYEASEYLPSAEDKFRKNAERWSEVEIKCRAKAEEYK